MPAQPTSSGGGARGDALIRILRRQCPTCIFRPGNVMHLRPGRLASMLRQCQETDGHIPCHEFLREPHGGDVAGPQARGAICRGFYDHEGFTPSVVTMAEAFDWICWVEPPDVKPG